MISPTMPMSMISGDSPLAETTVTFIFLARISPPSLPLRPHRHAAMLIDQVDDLFVDLADQDHLDDVEGLLIGDPHAAHIVAFDPHLVEHRVDLRPAAMNHHRIDADILEQDDILGEARFELLVFHGVAAILDDEGLAVKALEIGQRLHQHLSLADKVVHDLPSLAQSAHRDKKNMLGIGTVLDRVRSLGRNVT